MSFNIPGMIVPMSIKALRALGVDKEEPAVTQILTEEELESPIVTDGKHLQDKDRMFYGDNAVAEVERRLGRELPDHYKRIVREEGFFAGRYMDDAETPVVTAGVGQTGDYIGADLLDVFKDKETQAKSAVPHYDDLPEDVKGAILSAQYRGDLKPKYNWVKAFNDGKYAEAATHFLDHKEYKRRKKANPNDGVVKRMDDIAHILRSYE